MTITCRAWVDPKFLMVHNPPPEFCHMERIHQEVVLVPRTVATVAVLTLAGAVGMGSMADGYSYPGVPSAMDHQRKTVAWLLVHTRGLIGSGLGTGKTLCAIWAVDILQQHGAVRRVMIITPKATRHGVWDHEIFRALPMAKTAVLDGTRARRVSLTADMRNQWLITNPAGLRLLGELPAGVDLVIVDEATKFKNPKALHSCWLLAATKGIRTWLMTGTPAAQSPVDAYGLLRLLTQGQCMSYVRFRDKTMTKQSEFTWVPRADAVDTVWKSLQPCIRFSREECLELPEYTRQVLEVEMSQAQASAVERLLKEAAMQADGHTILASNAGVALGKARQVLAGGVYGTDEHSEQLAYQVDSEPLIDALEGVINEMDSPVLVFVQYRISAWVIAQALTARGLRVGRMTGGMTTKAVEECLAAVQNNQVDALVAVASTIAHGLTLTASSTIIWVTPPYSSEEYAQACARIYRKGQTRKCVEYRVIQHRLAARLFDRLDSKAALQETLLGLLERG